MLYAFYLFLFAVVIWFLGIMASYYHVKKYKMPGDKSMNVFFVFLFVAGLAFLWVINSVTGAVWGS